MIKLKELLTKEKLTEACWKGYKQVGMKDKGGKQVPNCVPIKEEGKLNEKTGGQRTYKSLLKLERGIRDLERNFKRGERDMDDERASNVKKSIGNMKMAWTAIWADFNER